MPITQTKIPVTESSLSQSWAPYQGWLGVSWSYVKEKFSPPFFFFFFKFYSTITNKIKVKQVLLLELARTIGMEVQFIFGRVFLFLSYRWNDSFPGTSVRHLSIAWVSSPSSGSTWGHRVSGSGGWSGRYVLRKHFNFMWGWQGEGQSEPPRPFNPLSQGPQLHAKNSTLGEWQSSWREALVSVGSQRAEWTPPDTAFCSQSRGIWLFSGFFFSCPNKPHIPSSEQSWIFSLSGWRR